MVTYEEWKKMPEEDKENLPESEYPEIPKEQLTNFLTKAVVKKMNGVFGWETTQEYRNKKNTAWFPEFKQMDVDGTPMWYMFNPFEGTYFLNVDWEPSLAEEPIGIYGLQWMHFMEKEYPEWVEVLQFEHRYLTEARKIDKSAWEYRLLLDAQYEKENPRPDNFEETVAWARTQQFFSDSTVMREMILVPPTVPTGETIE